jgi:hypothetical protein
MRMLFRVGISLLAGRRLAVSGGFGSDDRLFDR